MPLSAPAPREVIHTRQIECQGFRRDDGLWDIEANLTDVKSYPVERNWRGTVAPGSPIHGLWVRLTLDDDLLITAIETASDVTPYELCPTVTDNFQALVGIRIAPGWNRGVRERVGHGLGCTHLVEMLAQMATAAMQALWSEREPESEVVRHPEERRLPPALLNSCYAYRRDSDFMRQYFPKDYKEAG